MGTVIRPVISENNPNYISKHRYYELKHFCLQYPEWRREYRKLEFMGVGRSPYVFSRPSDISDPTARLALMRSIYSERMDIVDACCDLTSPDMSGYLKLAVTEGCTYDKLNARLCVPCSRKEFYELYRKFFYILDKERR